MTTKTNTPAQKGDFTPARKGDFALVERRHTAQFPRAGGAGFTSESWTTFGVEIVAAATRDGTVKRLRRNDHSFPTDVGADVRHIMIVPRRAALVASALVGREWETLDAAKAAFRSAVP